MAVAIFVAILVPILVSIMLILSGEQSRAAQERARARRIADAKMNARLLRLNI
jgi:Putative Flp pilus-assembly TadE/G-like